MQVMFIQNGKFSADLIDGTVIDFRNLNSPDHGNLSDGLLLKGARLAIITGVDDENARPPINLESPGDISRNSDCIIRVELDEKQRKQLGL
jgi:hypothetical protein